MKKINCYILLFIIFLGCNKNEDVKFQNCIDISYIPENIYDIENLGFSDLGAWHGYNLVPKDSPKYYGSFSGPLLMKMYGQWLCKSINKLTLYTPKGTQIDLSKFDYKPTYLPGRLTQTLKSDELEINISLHFISNRSAIQSTTIKNISKNEIELILNWDTELMNKNFKLNKESNSIIVSNKKSDDRFIVKFENVAKINIDTCHSKYHVETKPVIFKSNKARSFYNTQTYVFDNKELVEEKQILNSKFELLYHESLKLNEIRWNSYINNYFKTLSCDYDTDSFKRIAVKSIMTLMRNWRSPAGDLKHDGIFPSASYQGFYGFWSWDTWKHSVALASFNPELAKSGMFSMFDYQNEEGMVADCIYYNKKENNWRDTKAPLSAWAVFEIYKYTGDKEFVKTILPKIEKYHKWWYKYRDFNKNNICEYGSTDGTLIAAKWESGMDNAIRFDKSKMIKSTDISWSMNQESVDLNAYLFKEKLYLDKLNRVIGKKTNYKKEAEKIKQFINKNMFDKDLGFYFDLNTDTKTLISTLGPEGWTSLWVNISNKAQAEKVIEKILDEKIFNSRIPFPTIDLRHDKFNPRKGYWRGPVWLDQFYFGIQSLKNYGYDSEAKMLTDKLFENGEGIMTDGRLRENYHPTTGEGLNANDFSWSAAHILLLMQSE